MYINMASNINTIAVQLAGFLLEDIKGGGGRAKSIIGKVWAMIACILKSGS